MFNNPIIDKNFPDPTIIRHNGIYYMYSTETVVDGTIRYIPIYSSKNLVDWEYKNDVFKEPITWKEQGGLWAPCIKKIDDKFVLYYSVSLWGDENPGIGVATSKHPLGPFEDQGKLFLSSDIGVKNSIDPFVFIENENYLVWGSFHGIYIIELSADGLHLNGDKKKIASDLFEAPYILKHNDFYYLIASWGSCCEGINSTYRLKMGRSRNLYGPYISKEGKYLNESDGSIFLTRGKRFIGVGHHTMIKDDNNEYFIIYHGIDIDNPLENHKTRRVCLMNKVSFINDWPFVEDKSPCEIYQKKPYVKEI